MKESQGERTVLITGCSSGIGLASARELKRRSWRVFATARKPEDIARLEEEEGVESFYLDYAEPNSIAEVAERVLEAAHGRLDALFNNGAYGQPGAVEDLTREVLRAQFEANVFGWHDLTRRIIPAMREQGAGRIVFCSSVLGLISAPYRGAYCASKFAVEALADALRLELAGTGLQVVLIEPGPIATITLPCRLMRRSSFAASCRSARSTPSRPATRSSRPIVIRVRRLAVEGDCMEVLTNYAIPIALAAVACVLLLGLWNMMRGGSPNTSQLLMRWRVVLQFIALCLVMAAIYLAGR
jgi:NAD(P)-dependent dehydrogenase (short-subunit alcohol dehydrogenase family)